MTTCTSSAMVHPRLRCTHQKTWGWPIAGAYAYGKCDLLQKRAPERERERERERDWMKKSKNISKRIREVLWKWKCEIFI